RMFLIILWKIDVLGEIRDGYEPRTHHSMLIEVGLSLNRSKDLPSDMPLRSSRLKEMIRRTHVKVKKILIFWPEGGSEQLSPKSSSQVVGAPTSVETKSLESRCDNVHGIFSEPDVTQDKNCLGARVPEVPRSPELVH